MTPNPTQEQKAELFEWLWQKYEEDIVNMVNYYTWIRDYFLGNDPYVEHKLRPNRDFFVEGYNKAKEICERKEAELPIKTMDPMCDHRCFSWYCWTIVCIRCGWFASAEEYKLAKPDPAMLCWYDGKTKL